MHIFNCKVVQGNLIPLDPLKREFFNKLLNSYEELNKNAKVSIEIITTNINESQEALYRAFVLRASEHFGNTFSEMAMYLERYHPIIIDSRSKQLKPVSKWNTKELNDFIEQSNALLLEVDGDFKF